MGVDRWPDITMTVPELARKIGVAKSTCYEIVRREGIETVMVGNTMRVVVSSAKAWYHRQDYYQEETRRAERHLFTLMEERIAEVNKERSEFDPVADMFDDSEVF